MEHIHLIGTADCLCCSISERRRPYTFTQSEARPHRELRSFSQPNANLIFTDDCENQISIGGTEEKTNTNESNRLNSQQSIKKDSKELQLMAIKMPSSVDKAQKFFTESGILGPTNLGQSRELIKKTSRIHLDPSVKNRIRKTSLGFRSRNFGEHSAATQKCTHTTLETSNDLMIRNLQKQVYSLKGIIETGETKIIMLRAEVNQIKRVLQEMMYANSITDTNLASLENPNICVFCQEVPGLSGCNSTSQNAYTLKYL